MPHRQGYVVLIVYSPRYGGQSKSGHDFADEYHAAAPFLRGSAGGLLAAHVEAQIHFFEVSMERNWNAFETRFEEQKSNHAHIGSSVPVIELDAAGHARLEYSRVDLVVRHKQGSPLGGQERCSRHGRLAGIRINTQAMAANARMESHPP